MRRGLEIPMLCASVFMLGAACATPGFVEERVGASERRLTEQIGTTETRLTGRADAQEAKLQDTAARAGAIDQVGALASDAKTRAEVAVGAGRDAEARLSRRIADRNNYRVLDTRALFFESGQAEIRRDDVNQLQELAMALKADPNAILELQGFADPRGSDRYNNELARQRVEAVTRHLVAQHGVELRQIRAAAMGKASVDGTTGDALARARRVDVRLLTPWSSWEDQEALNERSDDAPAASPPTMTEPRPTPAVAPREVLQHDAQWRAIIDAIPREELGGKD